MLLFTQSPLCFSQFQFVLNVYVAWLSFLWFVYEAFEGISFFIFFQKLTSLLEQIKFQGWICMYSLK